VGTLQILVVDDHRSDRMLLGRVLQGAGHSVDLVADPELALDVLADRRMDLVLASNELPGMRGPEFLRHVRVMDAGRGRTPVVLLTVGPIARLQHAAHVLAKPLRLEGLLRVIEDACCRLTARPPLQASAVSQRQLLDDVGMDHMLIEQYVARSLEDAAERRCRLEAAMFTMHDGAWREACGALCAIAAAIEAPALAAAASEAHDAVDARQRRAALRAIDHALEALRDAPLHGEGAPQPVM
jgi:two-component system sensor histidine kinase RpfC